MGRGPTGNTLIQIYLCPSSAKLFWLNIPFPPEDSSDQGNYVPRQPASSWNKCKPEGTETFRRFLGVGGPVPSISTARSLPSRKYYFLKIILLEKAPLVNLLVSLFKKITSYSNYIHSNYTQVHCPSRKWTLEVQMQGQSDTWQRLQWLTGNPAVSYCSIALCF